MSHHSFLKYSVCSLSVRLVMEMRVEDISGTYSTFGMVAGSHSPFIFMIIQIVPIAIAWIDWPSPTDRKSTRLNSSHQIISYAVFCLKKKKTEMPRQHATRQLM